MPTPEGPAVPVPRYGEASLAELTPSLLAGLGVEGMTDSLAIGPLERACLLLVDGLGWEALRAHPGEAPFLNALADREQDGSGRPITAGFPATTVASLGSLGTGLPPGEHGLVGYTFAVPGLDRPVNAISWALAGVGPDADVERVLSPEGFAPGGTLLQRAMAAGVGVVRVGPADLDRTPLSRAIFRGGAYEDELSLGDLAALAADSLAAPGRRLVNAYHPGLDTTGHVRGVASESWRLELAHVDLVAEHLARRLPPGAALVVTGDHGMVDVPDDAKVDLADAPALAAGVRMLGGEARARYVYAEPGAAEDVFAAWRETLGDRMWVSTREQAIDDGWFGSRVTDDARSRIGDVVAAAHARVGVFERATDPLQAMLVGHHGSMTAAEQLVPLVIARA
jgi:predicted AlkP superfamily pyrophosphatase or phosphodiesterase